MNFSDLDQKLCLYKTKINLAVCMPHDQDSITAIQEATELGYVNCTIIGNKKIITDLLSKHAPNFTPNIIHSESEEDAALITVQLAKEKKVSAIMKGSITTPTLLKAILNKDYGIRKSNLLSHCFVFEWNNNFKIITDGGLVPHPTLEEKYEILRNAVEFSKLLGFSTPKVAVLSAVETISFKMPSTIDAAVLAKMYDRKQFKDCIVDGPLALDNAISVESAQHKGISGIVPGYADIIVVPDIDTGNVLGKSLIYFANVRAGGIVVGAEVPIILLSRSDDKQTRLNSIKLGLISVI